MNNLHLREIQHLQKQLDAIETIKKSILHRSRLLQQQKYKNYRNEYERLLGELSQKTNLPATAKRELRKRKAVLKQILDNNEEAR